LIALIDDFLRALGDPEGGEVLHALHAPDAALRLGDGIRPAAAVEPTTFALTHREISLRGREVLPRFGKVRLLPGLGGSAAVAPVAGESVAAERVVAESVVWFEVTELREERRLIAAVGLRAGQGDEPRIGWCTLADRVESWSYQDGLLQTLADYPWMRKVEPTPARALLDAGYFRRYWRAPLKFNTLPDARFSCQMSTVCCKHDFEINLPPEAQLVIDAMPWQRLAPELSGTQLRVRPEGDLQLKGLNETCRFIGPQRQCLVHQVLGRQPFGPCAVFPFAFAQTPEGIDVALSPICGASRLGIGVAPLDREDDLRERLVQAKPRATDRYRLAPDVEVSWENFRDIEKGLRDCLASEDMPLRRRLYVGSRLLGALRRNEPIDTNRWLAEPQAEITAELRAAIRGMVAKILAWDRATLQTLPRAIPSELHELEVAEAPIVTRILQNVLFSKVYSYQFDLTTGYNFLIVLYLVTLVMQAASSGPLPAVMWQELGSLGVHGLLKNVLHEGVPDGFRAVFGTSEFGQWALSA
jgi:hypothetical protein